MKITFDIQEGGTVRYDVHGLTSQELGDMMAFVQMYGDRAPTPELASKASNLHGGLEKALADSTRKED